MATKTKHARKKRAKLQSATDLVLPEKRNINFFVRLKKTNSEWAKEQAKALGCNASEYVDLLFDKMRSEQSGHA